MNNYMDNDINCGYVIEHIESHEHIVPDDVDFINCLDCKINHLICGSNVDVAYFTNSIIKKISINSTITTLRINDCQLEEIDVINNEKLVDIRIMDLHNNNLTKFDIEFDIEADSYLELNLSYNKIKDISIHIPKNTSLHIRGNPDIKLKYLDFLFSSYKDIRYSFGDCAKIFKLRYLTDDKTEDLYNRVINLKETYIDLKKYEITS